MIEKAAIELHNQQNRKRRIIQALAHEPKKHSKGEVVRIVMANRKLQKPPKRKLVAKKDNENL